ncbi:RcnB family protein [Salinicola acroporae]|uniref:Integral membrane-like protein n=1 Tax=Salinicola acroporae TaxID=1541440 RepID=A0ABT6I1G9_9GAMM|nr:RcnB family protein [Salinicola acroporae]MDH4571519.1 integral membrane-like protein [Salinicola acroporae]
MKHRVVTIGVLIAALGTAGIAQADPGHGHGKGHGPQGKGPHGHDHHDRHTRGHDGYRDHRGWHEGGHLADRYYRDDRYWVRDWHARHLREPPRGHRWLNIDGDYVLAAVATGVITAIILNH